MAVVKELVVDQTFGGPWAGHESKLGGCFVKRYFVLLFVLIVNREVTGEMWRYLNGNIFCVIGGGKWKQKKENFLG